ncbi:helix-turn-helix domain-containing protein [Paenibacillus sp. GYB003]|uniref:helix-turn-helix domain-containing protein n=1 Tax=Paenibacillus sp. GYB003 TaxID=2994392 RepID=UPI002F967A04
MQEIAHEFVTNRFYSPSDITNAGSLRLVRSGVNAAKPNYHIGPKSLDYYSLHFVVDGMVHFTFNGNRVLLSKGDLFCMFPDSSVYEYRIRPSDRTLRMYWLAFDGPQAPILLDWLDIESSQPYRVGLVDGKTERLLQRLIDETGAGPAAELAQLGAAYSLFAELQDKHNRTKAPESDWVDDCIRYMQLHYAEDINVKQIARYFGLNRSYASTALTKRLGQSPGRYIQSLRLQKAARLLRETSLSVTEIALSVGYPDLYSFSRAFAKAYRLSPSRFRAGAAQLPQETGKGAPPA